MLARRIDLFERNGLLISHGVELRNQSWGITPNPEGRLTQDLLASTATWWHLEDYFTLHGAALRLPGDEPDRVVSTILGGGTGC